MKPRAAWGPEEYSVALGRDKETVAVLQSKIGRGLTLEQARAAATSQGIDPDRVGKPDKGVK